MSTSFPKCQSENCEESALSFSALCWTHVEQSAYLAGLRQAIELLDRSAPALLNLTKVVCRMLDFSQLDLRGSVFGQADLTYCRFIGSDLSGCSLVGARFTACDFVGADLSRANLTRAAFTNSSFSYADLHDACLLEAHFRETDFMGTMLWNVNLWNADISGARHIRKKNFSHPSRAANFQKASLSEANALVALEAYRNIKHYFHQKGLYEDASWAAYRELTMERKHFFATKDPRYLPSLLMDLLSGYTEKPQRAILSSLGMVLLFGLIYYLVGALQPAGNPGVAVGVWDNIYFSFVTFTTVGFGDFIPKPSLWIKILVCTEAFSGPFMAGLYVFTLTRRYAAN